MTEKEKRVYVLHRVIRSEDDGDEEQTLRVFRSLDSATKAAAEWMIDVESMLNECGIQYECDYEGCTIYSGHDSWSAWVSDGTIEE